MTKIYKYYEKNIDKLYKMKYYKYKYACCRYIFRPVRVNKLHSDKKYLGGKSNNEQEKEN